MNQNQPTEITTGYQPREWQRSFHNMTTLKRFLVANVHRRGGKTVVSINDQVDLLLRSPLRQPQGVYVAPTYGQAKRVAWDYYKLFTKMIPNVEYKEGDLLIIIPRPHMNDVVKIWLLGAENPDSIRGMYLDHAIMDEYAAMNPIVWSQVIRPALSDRAGKAIFIGTPQGQNHFFDIYNAALDAPDWGAITLTVEDTGLISDSELESARRTMTEDEYNQEYMCSFTAALTGAYYSKYMQDAEEQGRITHVPYNPKLPVATFWDLGISDNMAIWFIQKAGQRYHVINYLEMAGKGIEFYVLALRDLGYTYSRHHFPHDIKQRELSTGVERQVTFEAKGLRPIIRVPKCKQKIDMINAVRLILPMCWFDKELCGAGVHALKNYQREWDPKKKKFDDKPRHDWTSHGADSFGTFGMGVTDGSFIAGIDYLDDLPKTAIMDYNEMDY